MDNKNINQSDNNWRLAEDAAAQAERQPYHTPKLIYYGELVELVQGKPKVGADTGPNTEDCSLT